MKINCIIILLTIVLGISCCAGCSANNNQPTQTSDASSTSNSIIEYQDENFLSDLAIGLEKRWNMSNNDTADYDLYTKEHQEAFSKMIDAELDILGKYENAEFEDSKLKEKALSYINALKDQKEALRYATVDAEKYDDAWSKAYDERTKLITEFSENFGLKISEEYQATLDDFLLNAQEVAKEEDKAAQVKELVKSIKFEKVEEEYDWATYEAVVENTTNIDFESLYLEINLLDKDKVIIDNQFVDVQNFNKGAKAKFKFSTDQKFKKIKIADYEYYVK